jgi:hypothetical protein
MVEFLRARLTEDEAAAERTLSAELRVGRFRGKTIPRWRITKSGHGLIDDDGGTLRAQQIFPAEAEHVVRHDPARVLAEVAAKRERIRLWNDLRILREGGGHEYDLAYGTATKGLQLDAAVHSGHPDYLKEWAP